jgi:hypothetical protein
MPKAAVIFSPINRIIIPAHQAESLFLILQAVKNDSRVVFAMGSELRTVRRSLMLKRTGSASIEARIRSWVKTLYCRAKQSKFLEEYQSYYVSPWAFVRSCCGRKIITTTCVGVYLMR